MRVTLISPYPDAYAFGVRVLSACLKKEGHNVQIIFLPKNFLYRYEDEILKEVVKLSRRSGLIGISLMTNFFDNAVQITRRLKESLSAPVLWGGIHPTIRPTESLKYADIVCIGEGEETLVELVRKIENGQDYHDVQGIAFKDKKIIINKIRPLIQDLDSIPFPDYEHETHYILHGTHIYKMNVYLLRRYMMGDIYMTMPTRGCPFSCTYCGNNAFRKIYPNWSVRKRSPDNVVKELMEAKSKLPFIDSIMFDDDHFFLAYTVQEIREFCKKYKENIGLPLTVMGASPTAITREKLSLLADAGMIGIRMGIQTGSGCTKRLYNRRYSNRQVEKAVKIINEFKDKIKLPIYDIILDNPWETEKDLIKTLMFLVKLPIPHSLSFFSLTFYPETDLYRKAKDEGIVTDDLRDVYRKCYGEIKRTYLNRLFFLLNEYAPSRSRIAPSMMSLLVNQKLRQLKLNWLLYIMLRVYAFPFRIRRFFLYDFPKGTRYIQKGGERFRIRRYILRSFCKYLPFRIN